MIHHDPSQFIQFIQAKLCFPIVFSIIFYLFSFQVADPVEVPIQISFSNQLRQPHIAGTGEDHFAKGAGRQKAPSLGKGQSQKNICDNIWEFYQIYTVYIYITRT